MLAATLAVVMFILPLFVPFPLLDPDEGLHAAIAQEMVASGSWTTPRFLGQPFLDKPILYFWGQAASLSAFGSSEWAVRLPGLLFGFLGMVTTGLLAGRLIERRVGWIAAIFYATTILPTALAQVPAHDVALIPWVNLSILLLWESHYAASPVRLLAGILGAGVFLGLSILTKGMLGVAAVGLAFGLYLLLARQVNRRAFLIAPAVLLIAVAIGAPWYCAVEAQNPGFLSYYFLDRHVGGLATDNQPHSNQPWWYYLPILLGGGLPWVGYLPVLVRDARDKRRTIDGVSLSTSDDGHPQPRRAPLLLLWAWFLGWTLFVTLAQSKLVTYLWPALPPMAMLAAVAWNRYLNASFSPAASRGLARSFVSSSLSGPIVLPAVGLVLQSLYDVRFDTVTWLAIGLVAVASPLPLLPWRKGRPQAALAVAGLSVAAQFLVAIALVLPSLADRFSARDLADYFNHRQQFPSRLLLADARVGGSLVFYLDPPLRSGLQPEQLVRLLPDRPAELLPGDVVALPEHRVYRLEKYPFLKDRPYQTINGYRLYQIGAAR